MLNRRFRREFQPDCNISIDESMVPFKGRSPFRQYIKSKPRKWGMKLWCLADAVTGYVQTFSVYTGVTPEAQGSLSYRVVINLIKLSGLAGFGYRLFVDNFFTSVELFQDLFSNFLTLACGTVRLGRRGFPKTVVSKKPENLPKERGSSVCAQKGPLLVTAWQDRKLVYIMSSFHSNNQGTVSRRVKVNGQFSRKEFSCPDSVVAYTSSMGGVDRADQLCRYYLPDRKGRKWNVKLLMYLLQMSVVNAFVLMKHSPNHQRRPKTLCLLDFVLELIDGLLSGYTSGAKRGRPALQPVENRLYTRCMPGTFQKPSWCHVCLSRFQKGMQKKRQTIHGCLDCDRHLCLPDCFAAYHTKLNYV